MEIIKVFLDPLSLFFLLMLLGTLRSLFSGILAWRKLLLLIVFMSFSAPAIVNPVLRTFELLVPETSCSTDRSLPIVVLGGGIDGRASSVADIHFLKLTTYVRLLEGKALFEQSNGEMLYLSGGVYNTIAESEVMASLVKLLGVPESSLILDTQSNNTFENATEVISLLGANREGKEVKLVTSAVHMLRAKMVFENMGISVCAIPVHFQALQNVSPYAVLPQTSVVIKSASLLHELVGLLYYGVTGKL